MEGPPAAKLVLLRVGVRVSGQGQGRARLLGLWLGSGLLELELGLGLGLFLLAESTLAMVSLRHEVIARTATLWPCAEQQRAALPCRIDHRRRGRGP